MKYLCLKCKTGFDDATGIQGTTKSGRRRLICPACGSRKYKYQDENNVFERRAAYAREYYRTLKSTAAGRSYLTAKSGKFVKRRQEQIGRRRTSEKRTIRKEGFTAHDIQEMTPPQLVKNWPKIVGAEK